jgi:kynurenine formamidase
VSEKNRPANWGRWGDSDELGAANLLTADHVLGSLRSAASSGRVYSLAQPIQAEGTPRSGAGLSLHLMSQDGGDYATGSLRAQGAGYSVAMDYLLLRLHGSATHVDALGHVWSGDQIYNGHPSGETSSAGLARCGVEKLTAIVTRGVLLDVAGDAGVDHLPDSHEITATELKASAGRAGVEIRKGDAVLVRTGWSTMYAHDSGRYVYDFPGIGLGAAEWLCEQDVVLVGADTLGVEVRTRENPWDLPVHLCLLRDHGVYMLELLDLERLAADRVNQFLFVLAPLPITGGSGSPVNPIAIA